MRLMRCWRNRLDKRIKHLSYELVEKPFNLLKNKLQTTVHLKSNLKILTLVDNKKDSFSHEMI